MGRSEAAQVASTARSLELEHALIRRRAGRVLFRSAAVAACLKGGWP